MSYQRLTVIHPKPISPVALAKMCRGVDRYYYLNGDRMPHRKHFVHRRSRFAAAIVGLAKAEARKD